MNWIFGKKEMLNIQLVTIVYLIVFLGMIAIFKISGDVILLFLFGYLALMFITNHIRNKYHPDLR